MKKTVLWITNIEMPAAAGYFGRSVVVGGWMHHASKLLSNRDDVELHIASMCGSDYDEIQIGSVYYSGFRDDDRKRTKETMREIIEMTNPDIIHIWGTEYYHSLAALEVSEEMGMLDRTVVSMQGLVHYISKYHYDSLLPEKVSTGQTLRDFYRSDSIRKRKDLMSKAGEDEVRALSIARNCIGRTDWDHACVKLINRDIRYFHCNEIMREGFYHNEWNYNGCQKHSVFFSQTNILLKGFHIMLEAAAIIKKRYPDFKIRVIGEEIPSSFISYLKDGSYRRYLRKLIDRYDLKENIEWLGPLSEEGMIEEFCRCNVFVCSSIIENSSNSVSEAMLLGVPVVASDVGGIKSMLEHEKEGILYQSDAPYMLAYNVMELFENSEHAKKLGRNARKRALKDHDPESNTKQLIDIYNKIMNI